MRIKKHQSMLIGNVLADEVFEEGRFACASLADDVDMRKPVMFLDVE